MRRLRSFLRQGPALGAMALLVALALLTFGLLSKSEKQSIDSNLADGVPTAAPSFKLPVLVADESGSTRLTKLQAGSLSPRLAHVLRSALADGQIDSAELRGIPVVLNLWASWCRPCREEAPILERGWRRDSSRNVLYLGVNVQDVSDPARAFLREFQVGYPNVRDQESRLPRDYGAIGIPETYFIDRQARVVGHVVGKVTPRVLATGVQAAGSGEVLGLLQGEAHYTGGSGGAKRVR